MTQGSPYISVSGYAVSMFPFLLTATPDLPVNMGAIPPARVDFKVIPATEEDCMTLAQTQAIAYDNAKKDTPETNIYQRMFGSYSDEVNAFREQGFVNKMQQDPTAHFFKAVTQDTNGQEKMMGWTLWYYFTEPKIVEHFKIETPWPSTANVDCANEFIGESTLVRAKYMNGKRFGWLQTLCVLPEYCGQGVGSALLRYGFSVGRGLGLKDFWVEATRDGHDLYERFGFRDVEATPMALHKYGGKGTAYIWGMRFMREYHIEDTTLDKFDLQVRNVLKMEDGTESTKEEIVRLYSDAVSKI